MATVTFYDQDNFGGMSTAVTVEGSMGESASSNLSYNSIKNGSSSWLVVWNQQNYSGDYLLVQPNTSLSDLNHVGRSGGGDWKDQITSFRLYSQQPSWWNSGVPPRS